MSKPPPQKPGRSKTDYQTPREFIEAVERAFGRLDWDLAAHQDNHIVSSWYGPGGVEEDSLTQDWSDIAGRCNGNLWLNPPYDDIGTWAKKSSETKLGPYDRIFFLVPASIGSNWYRDYVFNHALTIALNGRLSFDGKNPYPKDLILACYGYKPGFEIWDWKRDIRTRYAGM